MIARLGSVLPTATLALFAVVVPALAAAQDTVDVTVPTSMSFFVSDVSAATDATDNPFDITFARAQLSTGAQLTIRVRADGAFVPPSGPAIPASALSWQTASANGGSGTSGQVSTTNWVTVFTSGSNPLAGSVSLDWTLAAPGPGIRSGDHSLTLRWRIDSIP